MSSGGAITGLSVNIAEVGVEAFVAGEGGLAFPFRAFTVRAVCFSRCDGPCRFVSSWIIAGAKAGSIADISGIFACWNARFRKPVSRQFVILRTLADLAFIRRARSLSRSGVISDSARIISLLFVDMT